MPGGLVLDWRYFSLEEVNQKAGPDRHVWDRPDGYEAQGLDAFAGLEAARRQDGAGNWEEFLMALFQARHGPEKQVLSPGLIVRLAQSAGFDGERLRSDMADPTILDRLAADHRAAVEEGIFGTPTLVFENGASAYVKLRPAPRGREALEAWQHVAGIVRDRPYIQEVKRP